MALLDLLEPLLSLPGLVALLFIPLLSTAIYRAYFSPLAHIPGPLIARTTSLWLYFQSYIGNEATAIDQLHQQYGPVVRIAPNEVDISDGSALAPIYTERVGFLKAQCYRNFDIEGHQSIFSAIDMGHRAQRAKAVVPMFATKSIREGIKAIEDCVDRFVDRMAEEGKSKKPVDILNLTRSLAVDAVSSYLFGKSYNGIGQKEGLTASEFVNSFVAVGRFFYLPTPVFLFLEYWTARLNPEKKEVDKSFGSVMGFAENVVDESSENDPTYPGRLLKAGISRDETVAQCLDLMFAGTDSTGMNLATICWHLAQNPEMYGRLRKDVLSSDPSADPQTLPYLSAVLKEGLRLAMANPTRFPRVVPSQGWTFQCSVDGKSYFVPGGTNVGCQPFTLHLNPSIFPKPNNFLPERWLEATPEMLRDFIPFGLGPRQCIARNLAMVELAYATRALAKADVLKGAKAKGEVKIAEWFNSKVYGEKIELEW